MQTEFQTIKDLVGETITEENLKFVDCYVNQNLSIFMPVGGQCGYAVSPSHTHPSYMFVISYDNEMEVLFKNKKLTSSVDTMFCLSPDIKHSEVQNYLPPKYAAIFIDKIFFEKALESYGREPIVIDGEILDVKNSKIHNLINEFMVESADGFGGKDLILDSLANVVTHQIIRLLLKIESSENRGWNSTAISKAVKFANSNYDKDLSVTELAEKAGLSKSRFTELFIKETGLSPMEYLKRVRLQTAKKLLLKNELSVTEISGKCGFNSPAYFSKNFKETFNETPREFLKRAR